MDGVSATAGAVVAVCATTGSDAEAAVTGAVEVDQLAYRSVSAGDAAGGTGPGVAVGVEATWAAVGGAALPVVATAGAAALVAGDGWPAVPYRLDSLEGVAVTLPMTVEEA